MQEKYKFETRDDLDSQGSISDKWHPNYFSITICIGLFLLFAALIVGGLQIVKVVPLLGMTLPIFCFCFMTSIKNFDPFQINRFVSFSLLFHFILFYFFLGKSIFLINQIPMLVVIALIVWCSVLEKPLPFHLSNHSKPIILIGLALGSFFVFDTRYQHSVWDTIHPELSYSWMALLTILCCFAYFTFLFEESPFSGTFFESPNFSTANRSLLSLLIVALPLGYLIGFVKWNPIISEHLGEAFLQILKTFAGVFFFIAIPEELVFRGILQRSLFQKFKLPVWLSIAIASGVFALTHLNNPPMMNSSYVLMAFIAGIFYGYSYHVSKHNIWVPVYVHTWIDVIWSQFFFAHSI